MKLGVVILGAGASSRMGSPKLLLPWGGTTVVGHLIRLWGGLGAEQARVVCGERDLELQREVEISRGARAGCILNPQPELGMWGSIQCAARWTGWPADMAHWAIALGDQPHLPAEALAELIRAAARSPELVWQPSRNGRGRHPVILPRGYFIALAGAPATTLKEFLQERSENIRYWPSDNPAFDRDLDRPEEYEELRRLYASA